MRLEAWVYGFTVAALMCLSLKSYALDYYFSGTFKQGLPRPIENTEPMVIYPESNDLSLDPIQQLSYHSLTSFYAALMEIELDYHHMILGAGLELGVLSREIVGALPLQYYIQAGSESSKLFLSHLDIGMPLTKNTLISIRPQIGLANTYMYNFQSHFIPMTLKQHEEVTMQTNMAYGVELKLERQQQSHDYFAILNFIAIKPAEVDIESREIPLHLHTHHLNMLRLVIGMVI